MIDTLKTEPTPITDKAVIWMPVPPDGEPQPFVPVMVGAELERTIATLRAECEGLRADKARLDWLDGKKVEWFGGWAGAGGLDDPTEWRNPHVEWKVSRSVQCGEYKMPDELKRLTVRDAIDAASRGTEGQG